MKRTALDLVRSLTPEQQKTAILPGEAPAELITAQERKVQALQPAGIAASALTDAQRTQLWRVISEYVDRFRPDLTANAKASLQKDGGNLTFGWMGNTETGGPHYYRIQSPQFLFEYDNTQNNARHPMPCGATSMETSEPICLRPTTSRITAESDFNVPLTRFLI